MNSSSTDSATLLSSGDRIDPYEQRWVMRSADLSGLVREGSVVRPLRIIPVTGRWLASQSSRPGVLVPSGLIVGDYVGGGGLEGSSFRFGRGA